MADLPQKAAEYLSVGEEVQLFADFNATDEEGRPFTARFESITQPGEHPTLLFVSSGDRGEMEKLAGELRRVAKEDEAFLRIYIRSGGNPFREFSPGVLLQVLPPVGAETPFAPKEVAERRFEVQFRTRIV